MGIFFILHSILIAYVMYPFSKYNTVCALVVLAHWLTNDFFCVLTQFEARVFRRTLFGTRHAPRITRAHVFLLMASQAIKHVML